MEPHYTNMCYPKCGELNAHMNMKNLAQGWKLGYPSSKPQPLICPRQSDRRPPIHRASYPGEFAVRVDEDIEKQFLESFLTGQQADYLSQNPTTSVCLWFCSCKIARPEISGHFEAGKGPFEDIPPCSHVTMKWKLRIILRRGVVCLPDHPSNISWWLYQEKYFHMAIGYSSTWLFCNNKKLSLENFPTSLSKNHQFLGILDLGHQVTTSLFGSIVSGPAKASVPLLLNSAPEVQKKMDSIFNRGPKCWQPNSKKFGKHSTTKSTTTFVTAGCRTMFIHDFRSYRIWRVLSNLQLQL